jgi:hypothetical protein
MTGVLSIITPVYGPTIVHLPAAYASLLAQELPDGWAWEWLVQEDGETGDVIAELPMDNRISAGSGRHGGAGTARTLALARSHGSLIKVLDADDQLMPGALARDIDVLSRYPNIGWTTSRVLDLLDDGLTVGFDDDPSPGPLGRDVVLDYWLANDYRAPVHPATLCLRRDLVVALGGWMALPASEDTGLLLAASVISNGYFIPEPGLLYRKWAHQVTSQAAHTHPTERAARMSIIEARALVLRDTWPAVK